MNRGFSFVELMVSIFIIGLLVLLSFPFYSSLGKGMALRRSATRMVQDFRKTQELAMSAQENNGQIPMGGYGIYIPGMPATSYSIFADKDGDQRYDSSKDELVETVNLEKGVSITTVFRNIRSIGFLAPDPKVSFANPGGVLNDTANEAAITLSDGTSTVTVHINRAGLVYY